MYKKIKATVVIEVETSGPINFKNIKEELARDGWRGVDGSYLHLIAIEVPENVTNENDIDRGRYESGGI